MTKTETKNIQQKKKTNYNVYGVKDRTFYLCAGIFCGLIAGALLQLVAAPLALPVRAALAVIAIGAGAVIGLLKSPGSGRKILPYRRQDGFEFIGLYDLSAREDLRGSDVLSRETEVEYIDQLLETLIFRQNSIKQAICLTGKSGCGKSTILSFFKQKYQDRYQIYDLTGSYSHFQAALTECFGLHLDQELIARTREQKLVFILDQFERFFFLDEEKKEQIRSAISVLSRKNAAIILSMREEYLADFMKEFDINNMKDGARGLQDTENTGILNNLTSIIRDDRKNYHVQETAAAFQLSKWGSETIKDRSMMHLEHVGSHSQTAALDPVGNTIFYCENQNDVKVRCNGTEEEATLLQSKCEILFGAKGRTLYEKHKQEPLIQQQITYHMMEYEKKVKETSMEELERMFGEEDYELLNHYFDTQLTAAGNFFHASRILYLLSQARLNHVVMKRPDLEYGLFEDQFSKDGHKEVNQMIDRLEELQLIRRNVKRSDQEYEIAHDFIAQAFLNYSNSSMDRNVKSALDIYMAEYLDANKKTYIEQKRRHSAKAQKSGYYRNLFLVFSLLAIAVDAIVHFAFNPWLDLWKGSNVYGDIFTFVPLLMTEACMIYIFHVYQKVVQFYRGPKETASKVIYAVIMAAAVLANFFYPHGLIFYGLGLALMGANCAFLLNDSYQKASRMEMRNYGLKCSMIGLVFAVVHLIFWAFNSQFPTYIIFVEMAMMVILVVYAYLAHMTREYLYGRRMDASSDRGDV